MIILILVNISTIYAIRSVFKYKIAVDARAIYVNLVDRPGPMLEMRFKEIQTVDLKPNSDVMGTSNGVGNPSKIVLYRKGWDGQEMFALDLSRTNLGQFKDLVRLIHERCPGTFTQDALRYLNSPKLMTPRENRQGELVW